jgi:hypothetical protein
VEVKVGILHVNREIVVETTQSAADVEKAFTAAREADDGLFALTDDRGRTVLIPAVSIGYVDLGPESTRHVGFGLGG